MEKQILKIHEPNFKDLKQEVYSFLLEKGIPVKRPKMMLFKASFLWTLWFISYGLFLFFGRESLASAILLTLPWTFIMLVIQLSVMHDASHGAVSDHTWVNRLMTFSISFLGGSALLWRNQHCQAHHSFTNVHGSDHDIDTNGLLRLHPEQDLKWYHQYQHFYAWLLYPLFILSWIWWGDFRDIFNNTYSIGSKRMKQVIVEVILVKAWHSFLFLAVPMYFFGSLWVTVSCYLLGFSILGLFMVVIFQLAHVTGIQALPNRPRNEDDWILKQVSTTADFSVKNHFLTWCTGGLNFQVEHHLFPLMGHINYPIVQPIVKRYCLKNGLPYLAQSSLYSAIKGHQRHLVNLGQVSI